MSTDDSNGTAAVGAGGDDDAPLPPLTSIWDCEFVEKTIEEIDGVVIKVWKCLHPGCTRYKKPNKQHNASKVLAHFMRQRGMNVAALCTGAISVPKMNQYKDLQDGKAFAKMDKAQKKRQLTTDIHDTQAEVAAMLTGATKPAYCEATHSNVILPARMRSYAALSSVAR